MKMTARLALLTIFIAGVLGTNSLLAQTFTGSNSSGAATNFSFSLNAAATNLSVIIPANGGAFSHLLIRKGSAPTDTDYDFVAASGQTNALHLEMPELSPGTYFIRVRTPAASPPHNFMVLVETNVADMRSAARPVSKKLDSETITAISGRMRGSSSRNAIRTSTVAF